MSKSSHNSRLKDKQKAAFHKAAYVTGFYYNSHLNNLPPIYFQNWFNSHLNNLSPIYFQSYFNSAERDPENSAKAALQDTAALVDIDQCLQSSFPTVTKLRYTNLVTKPKWASVYTDDYRLAVEANIVSRLAGPLAEAKYCAQNDNEPFSQQLLTVQALKNYGGETDLAVVEDYLQGHSTNKQLQNALLKQFFAQAFHFVNASDNWKAITRLARHILTNEENGLSHANNAQPALFSYHKL
jgi:hypothetical protein